MTALFLNLSADTARTYGLVLEACGVDHQVRSYGRQWAVDVPVGRRSAACHAIAKYLEENKTSLPLDGIPLSLPQGQKTYSAIYAVTPLVLIHWAVVSADEYRSLVNSFGADTGHILRGSLYRCLTALLLHVDWAHLLSNVAALILFGTALAYTAGWGVAWLLILLGGAGGNLLAALWYGQGHMSVGASTAVFSAVGLLSATSFWRGFRRRDWSWRLWTPLAGGLATLGLLGAAPHTDLVAHMMGFIAGLAIGLTWSWAVPVVRWPIQVVAALLTAGLIIISWVLGLGYSG